MFMFWKYKDTYCCQNISEIKFVYFFSTVSSIFKKVNILYVPIDNSGGNMIV